MKERIANNEEIGFRNTQVPVEDIDEFAFDPSNITLPESVGDHGPMDVFQRRVIGVLGRDDESAEENAVKGPLFGLDGEIGPGASDVDEGNKDIGDGDFGSLDNVRHELSEL